MLGTRPSADLAFQGDADSFLHAPAAAAPGADGAAHAGGAPAASAAGGAAAAAGVAAPTNEASTPPVPLPQAVPGHIFSGGIEHREGEPWVTLFPDAPDDARDLLDRLLQWRAERRPSVADALAHPYFDAVRDKYAGQPEPPPLPTGEGGFEFSFEELGAALDAEGACGAQALPTRGVPRCQTLLRLCVL